MVVQGSSLKNTDKVDDFLEQQEGKINQERDPQLCHHGYHQKCTNCLPLDPYDEEYLKKKDIKHMSFHAYVRKLTDLHGKGTRLVQPLENIDLKVNLSCAGTHRPYPQGICTKCRPPVLTLNRQRFRHVDNLTVENEHIVNRFLDFWRGSSYQRVGYLIGQYEPFQEVPLGIKANVVAIYEPPQRCSENGVSFEEDANEAIVDELCRALNFKRVGWIFTDLWSSDNLKGTVHCTRHGDSFLLSAAECITAGAFQSKYKNFTKYCSDGAFGSKFVTVVASGDKANHINFTGYQVSNQCTAMVDADILVPTDYMELAYVRDKPLHEKHYVTDVQFTEKNEYGAEVRRDGRPMPVEYLLVDVPAGMPKDPCETFHISQAGFPIENRSIIGQVQSTSRVMEYIGAFSSNQFIDLASNFHFLVYLLTNDLMKFPKQEVFELVQHISSRDRVKAAEWAERNATWKQFIQVLQEHAHQGGPGSVPEASNSGGNAHWSCEHCTFENTEPRADCEMCGLPAN